jgi:hypothetical protein
LRAQLVHLSDLVRLANERSAEAAALSAEAAALEKSLAHALGAGEVAAVRNPLHAAAAAPAPAEAWVRYSDEEGDVWYVGPQGDTAWTPPPGAVVTDAH